MGIEGIEISKLSGKLQQLATAADLSLIHI